MKKLFLTFFPLVILIACDTTFRAEKVETKNYNHEELYETYLVSNASNAKKERYPILLSFLEKRLNEINKTDTNIVKFVSEFYDNVSCTRRYYKNYKNLKGVESIVERCEEYYCGSFTYEKSKENNNQWYLTYPKNMKDTIYCK